MGRRSWRENERSGEASANLGRSKTPQSPAHQAPFARRPSGRASVPPRALSQLGGRRWLAGAGEVTGYRSSHLPPPLPRRVAESPELRSPKRK